MSRSPAKWCALMHQPLYQTKPNKINPIFFLTPNKLTTMSFSSSFRLFFPKFPNSLPLFKTLTLSPPFPLSPINLQIIKPITIQSIPTRSFPINSTSQSSSNPNNNNTLQPIEELPKSFKKSSIFSSPYKTQEPSMNSCCSMARTLNPSKPSSKLMKIRSKADSDSVLTKGLAALLVQGLSGHTVQEILRVSPDFIVLLGLQQSLTPSRNNGFLNMLKLMQKKAFTLFVEAEKGVESRNEIKKPVEKAESGSNFENPIENSKSNNDDDDVDVDVGVLGSRGQRILEILKRELAPVELEVKDVSYQHAGHAGVRGSNNGETHFELKVVSKEFEGKSMVKRHRLVYSLLADELENGLHALSIDAKTPTEIGQ
ncbi:putative BolA protein [Helianthus annuus]|nr:putative BolA protein [Helianthus annuus]